MVEGEVVTEWYYQLENRILGPFSLKELQILAAKGKLSPEHRVRRGVHGPWQMAVDVSGLLAAEPVTARPQVPSAHISDDRKTSGGSERVILGTVIGAGVALLILLLLILAFGHAGRFSQTGTAGVAKDGPYRGQVNGAGDGRGVGASAASGRQRGAYQNLSSDSNAARIDSPESNNDSNDSDKHSTDSSWFDSDGHQLTSRDPLPKREYVVNPVGNGGGNIAADVSGSEGRGSEFFGVKAHGRTFVYVVDRSGSMDGTPFAKAREELLRSLDNLSSRQTFYVIFFDNQSYPMFSPGQAETAALRATSRNVDRVRQWTDSLMGGGGGTDPQASLLHALELQPDAIYLLSDGQFEAGIVDDVSRHNHGRVVISTIAFINKIGEPLLKQLAHKNGGAYRFVP